MIKIGREYYKNNILVVEFISFFDAVKMNDKAHDNLVNEVLYEMRECVGNGGKVKFKREIVLENNTSYEVLLPDHDEINALLTGVDEEKYTTLEQINELKESVNKIQSLINN